jgi:hypothetical protein
MLYYIQRTRTEVTWRPWKIPPVVAIDAFFAIRMLAVSHQGV